MLNSYYYAPRPMSAIITPIMAMTAEMTQKRMVTLASGQPSASK